MSIVGDLLRLKRMEKKLTLENVADYVGVSINYISKLEKGENSNPSDEIIVKLSEVLDINEDELFQAFGKIPLSTRIVLYENPHIAKALSQLNELNKAQRDKIAERIIYWFKKLSKDD